MTKHRQLEEAYSPVHKEDQQHGLEMLETESPRELPLSDEDAPMLRVEDVTLPNMLSLNYVGLYSQYAAVGNCGVSYFISVCRCIDYMHQFFTV